MGTREVRRASSRVAALARRKSRGRNGVGSIVVLQLAGRMALEETSLGAVKAEQEHARCVPTNSHAAAKPTPQGNVFDIYPLTRVRRARNTGYCLWCCVVVEPYLWVPVSVPPMHLRHLHPQLGGSCVD